MKPKIIVILGPTSSGKSDVAVEVAKKINGEIISADSRQVYRGMDIGSGKITKKEMCRIPHHMLDIADPKKQFSVAEYKVKAEECIKKILSKGKIPIICGGTGFYIDAITKNIILPEVPPNQKLRGALAKIDTPELLKILKSADRTRYNSIDKNNRIRIIRAIEIVKAIGKVPKIHHYKSKYNFVFIGLDLDDKILKDRIANRLKKRMKAGMLREVERLHKGGLSWKKLESFGLEYKNCALFLQGKIDENMLIGNIEKESWKYVKRQRTWFKRNGKIKWYSYKQSKKILNIIR